MSDGLLWLSVLRDGAIRAKTTFQIVAADNTNYKIIVGSRAWYVMRENEEQTLKEFVFKLIAVAANTPIGPDE